MTTLTATGSPTANVVIPRQPVDDFLVRAIADLEKAETDGDEESRNRTIRSIRHQLRQHLAALRLHADPRHQAQMSALVDRIGRGDLGPTISLDEFDERFAEDLEPPK